MWFVFVIMFILDGECWFLGLVVKFGWEDYLNVIVLVV